MNVRYVVELSPAEQEHLQVLLSCGSKLARQLKRAQILLSAHAGRPDGEIAALVRVGLSSVYRTKRRFVEGGLERALNDDPRPGAGRKLAGREEALLVASACAAPPAGYAKWTCQLLAGELVRLTEHESLSGETVRRRLAEKRIKPWQEKMWCIPKVDAEYVARMEDVLDLYAQSPPPNQAVVCVDETPVQLIGEKREPIPARPGGALARIDYEYRRCGTANLFVFLDAHKPWRHVKVTAHRACADFAECMRDLVDHHYPEASRIRVVLDNLSAHSPAALYKRFSAEEARRILRRLEFHFVPKHASWLNMVEIEIGVLKSQCLARRLGDRETLEREIAAWERARNDAKSRIKWLFTVEKARDKMQRAYPGLDRTPHENAA
jgi:transposase